MSLCKIMWRDPPMYRDSALFPHSRRFSGSPVEAARWCSSVVSSSEINLSFFVFMSSFLFLHIFLLPFLLTSLSSSLLCFCPFCALLSSVSCFNLYFLSHIFYSLSSPCTSVLSLISLLIEFSCFLILFINLSIHLSCYFHPLFRSFCAILACNS